MSGSGQTLTLPIDWGALFRVKCAYCGGVPSGAWRSCDYCGAPIRRGQRINVMTLGDTKSRYIEVEA